MAQFLAGSEMVLLSYPTAVTCKEWNQRVYRGEWVESKSKVIFWIRFQDWWCVVLREIDFRFKIFANGFNSIASVETSYLHTDMCKSESSLLAAIGRIFLAMTEKCQFGNNFWKYKLVKIFTAYYNAVTGRVDWFKSFDLWFKANNKNQNKHVVLELCVMSMTQLISILIGFHIAYRVLV